VAETAPESGADRAARAPGRVAPAPASGPPLVAPPPAPAQHSAGRATSETSGGDRAGTDAAPAAAPERAAPTREPYGGQPTATPPPSESTREAERAAVEDQPTHLEREPAPSAGQAAAPRDEPTALAPDDARTREPLAPAANAEPTAPEPEPEPELAEAPAAAPLIAVVDPCRRARAHWSAASSTLRERMDTLARCLDAESYACRASAAALTPALTDLEWAEQRVEAACPR
jgi:hypothetical protein